MTYEYVPRLELLSIINEYENFNFNTAISKINSIKGSSEFNGWDFANKFVLIYYHIRICRSLLAYEECFRIFEELRKAFTLNEKKNDFYTFLFYALETWILIKKKESEKVLENFQKVENVIHIFETHYSSNWDQISFKTLIQYYIDISEYYQKKDKKEAIKYINQALLLGKKITNPFYVFRTYLKLFVLEEYKFRQDSDPVIDEFTNYFVQLDNPFFLSLSYIEVCNLLNQHLKLSLDYSLKALTAISRIKISTEAETDSICNIYNSLGLIFGYMGNYTESINYLKKGLKFNNENYNGIFLLNLSEVNDKIGTLERAIDYCSQAAKKFSLDKGVNLGYRGLGAAYYNLCLFWIKKDNLPNAEENLYNLGKLNQKWSHLSIPLIQQENKIRYNLAKARVNIHKESIKTNADAQLLLREIIETPNLSTELFLEAIFPYIELLIQEYRIFENQKVFNSIKILFEKIGSLIENLNLIPIKISLLLLQGKFEIVLGNFPRCEKIYENAMDLAKEYDLFRYITLIENESNEFKNEIQKYETLLMDNTSLKERIERIELEDYVKNINKLFEIQEKGT